MILVQILLSAMDVFSVEGCCLLVEVFVNWYPARPAVKRDICIRNKQC